MLDFEHWMRLGREIDESLTVGTKSEKSKEDIAYISVRFRDAWNAVLKQLSEETKKPFSRATYILAGLAVFLELVQSVKRAQSTRTVEEQIDSLLKDVLKNDQV